MERETRRCPAYDGQGHEVGMLSIREAEQIYDFMEYDAKTDTLSVGPCLHGYAEPTVEDMRDAAADIREHEDREEDR